MSPFASYVKGKTPVVPVCSTSGSFYFMCFDKVCFVLISPLRLTGG